MRTRRRKQRAIGGQALQRQEQDHTHTFLLSLPPSLPPSHHTCAVDEEEGPGEEEEAKGDWRTGAAEARA